jgi:hypothetical protein
VTEPPVDAVYVVVRRYTPAAPFGGIYFMERMDNRIWQTVEDAYAVDSGVSNPMDTPAAAILAQSLTGAVSFSADNPVFDASAVGRVVRMAGGIATISTFVNSSRINGTWVVSPSSGSTGFPYAASGNWTIATPITSIRATHLAGMTLSGLADGVPLTNLACDANGYVTLPFAASNVKVGLPFTVQVQTPYLNSASQPTEQGRRKVIPAATFRLAGTGNNFQTGTNQPDGASQNPPQLAPAWTNLTTANTTAPTGNQQPAPTYTSPGGQQVTQLWTGDLRVVGNGADWDSKGQVAIQQTLPLPLEIVACIPESLPGDLPEVAIQAQQQSAGRGQPQQPARGPGRWMISGDRI